NRIRHKEPLNISSTSRHNASRIVASELFPVINSRIFFSAPSTASAHLRSPMSWFVPYHLTSFPSRRIAARNGTRTNDTPHRSAAAELPIPHVPPEPPPVCET